MSHGHLLMLPPAGVSELTNWPANSRDFSLGDFSPWELCSRRHIVKRPETFIIWNAFCFCYLHCCGPISQHIISRGIID